MAIGEISVGDLPVMSATDFTANDYVFIIDNGRLAKKISRHDFFSVVQALVKGDKGDQGIPGPAGSKGDKGDKGDKGVKGDVGTKGDTGSQGLKGDIGDNGWSPILSLVVDGERRVLRLIDWLGGTGNKPTSGSYIGSSGLVSTPSQAIDVRGSIGAKGDKGDKGSDGVNGSDAKQISTIEYQPNNSLKFKFTDLTEITSTAPTLITGWGSYKDTIYTQANKFSIAQNTQVVVPNNGATKIENQLPTGATTLYNTSNQKITPVNATSLYGVRVRFKVVNSGTTTDFISVSLEKATTDVPFTDDKVLRADVSPQSIDINTIVYSDATALSNGFTVRLKSGASAIQIYDVEFIISKLT